MKTKSATLVEQTATAMVDYFTENHIQIGDRLPNEYKLAEALNVGRSTLREAIKMLVSKNMVEVRQGSGTYVTSLTEAIDDPLGFGDVEDALKLTMDLFEVRFLIEPRMAALAAEHISDDELAILKKLMIAIEEDIDLEQSIHRELDVQFHSLIAEASRNVAMQQLIPIVMQSIKLYNEKFTNKKSKEATLQAHREIYRALKARSPQRAYDAMLLHMAGNRRMLQQKEDTYRHFTD